MTTIEAKGLFPETHPMALRGYGLAACPWPRHYILKDPANPVPYDALLVLGSSLQGLATDRWDQTLIPSGPFMHVDLDHRVIGRDFPIAFGIIAELGVALDDLIEFGKALNPNPDEARWRRDFLANLKRTVPPYVDPGKRNSGAEPIPPQSLMGCLSELLPKHSHIFIDGGNCIGWALHYLEIDPPAQVHCAWTWARWASASGQSSATRSAQGSHVYFYHRRRRFPHARSRGVHRGPVWRRRHLDCAARQ